jgi:5-methylcytosine-specific restriction endonuclease McrA
MLTRRTPLKAKKRLKPSGKWAGKSARERKALRKAERFRRTFGPDGFVRWLKAQPCEACGDGPSEVHHEPPRSQGGTWVSTLPLCTVCHRLRHSTGVRTFWRELQRDYGMVTREVQARWLARGSA